MLKTLFTVVPLLAAIASTSARPYARAPIDETTLTKVRANAIAISKKSWEIGTLTEALLEYSWPQLSVFNNSGTIPPSRQLYTPDYPYDVVKIATGVVEAKPSDIMSLMRDGASGDPASIGPAVILANWTRNDTSDTRFSVAAGSQLDYLLNYVPRTDDGTISHRTAEVQLWSDFVYMGPPFIAYFGATQQGNNRTTLLQTAYDQCRLYRQHLQESTTKLWQHVLLSSWQDTHLWATGNAWAAAGMLRVLQTLRISAVSESFVEQQKDLTNWVEEILKASWDRQTSAGAIRNVINDTSSFEDTASTALIASVTFRLAVLTGDNSTYVPKAEAAYHFVHKNIDSDGWLRNTVDPLDWLVLANSSNPSPEGQSFVLLLESARRDYLEWVESETPAPCDDGTETGYSDY